MDRPHRPQLGRQRTSSYGSFIINRDQRTEPTLQGNNLPGFGDVRPARRYFLSLGYTRILSPSMTNELRAGLNRVRIDFHRTFTRRPCRRSASHRPRACSRISTFPGAMSFGGISGFPQGRGDTTYQYTDTLGWVRGRHSIRMGGEYRRFDNNNFNGGTGGVITFGTMAAFLAGTPTSATQTARRATPALRVNAFGAFVQDDFKAQREADAESRPALGVQRRPVREVQPALGLRLRAAIRWCGWERTASSGPTSGSSPNFGPRVGFAYDPFGGGKTVIRGGFGHLLRPAGDQYREQASGSNPPFSASVNNTSNISLANPFAAPARSGQRNQRDRSELPRRHGALVQLQRAARSRRNRVPGGVCRKRGPSPADHWRLEPGHQRRPPDFRLQQHQYPAVGFEFQLQRSVAERQPAAHAAT